MRKSRPKTLLMVGHQRHKYCETLLIGMAKKKPPQNPINGGAPTENKYCGTLLMGMAKKEPPRTLLMVRHQRQIILRNPINGYGKERAAPELC